MSSHPEFDPLHTRETLAMTNSVTRAALAALCLLFAAAPMADEAPEAPAESVAAPSTETSVDTDAVADAEADEGPAEDEAANEDAEPELPAMRFESPDAAAMALIEAAGDEDRGVLFAVLGSDIASLTSGDPVADAADRRRFVELAEEGAHLEEEDEESAILVVGPDDWPFPIPLVKDDAGWYFDTEAGLEEILDRRIGLNELYALAAARAYVAAQLEYAAADANADGRADYAQYLLSSEGQRDGLYWPTAEGEPESPLGPLVADAVDEGYDDERGEERAASLPRLLLQDPHRPGRKCPRWRAELCARRQAGGWLRPSGLASHLRKLRDHDLPGQSAGDGLRGRSGRGHRDDRLGNDRVRSRRRLGPVGRLRGREVPRPGPRMAREPIADPAWIGAAL